MDILEIGGCDREHTEWLRHAAVETARQINRYERNLDEILKTAERILEFITAPTEAARQRAEVIPLRIAAQNPAEKVKALAAFKQSYERDGAAQMTEPQFSRWLRKQPKEQVQAFLSLAADGNGGDAA